MVRSNRSSDYWPRKENPIPTWRRGGNLNEASHFQAKFDDAKKDRTAAINEGTPLTSITDYQQNIAAGICELSRLQEVSLANQYQMAMDKLDPTVPNYLENLRKLGLAIWNSIQTDVRN
ncbi:MAG: hypothetical protein QF793_02505 [Candidatus Peribacteraceae bacterium]|jgi:hypothetical protein|nr:hypothetical protein [bacterium]MDP6561774.1 hypothetical protein [Candidatus Peribacteraceae bacterium]|tara:strand:- start:4775 stop:5131 length:357 start_codon:yes stop_codon:yes gene_type:complete